MDPNLFHVDWERTFEALTLIVILAFVIERALAVLFENRWLLPYFDGTGYKEMIALAVSISVCMVWDFDAISMIILTEHTTAAGCVITGAVIAGGSKASLKLFHDLLDVKSQALRETRAADALAPDQIPRDVATTKVKAGGGLALVIIILVVLGAILARREVRSTTEGLAAPGTITTLGSQGDGGEANALN